MKKSFGHLASLILLVSSGVFGFDEQLIVVKDEGDFSTNWHQFRGPSASGVSSTAEPPTEWSETKNIKWKFDIEGVGSSTPIVWNNRVFFTSAIKTERVDPDLPAPEDQPRNGFFNIKAPNAFYQFVVFCVNRSSGKLLWKKVAVEAVPSEGRHPDNNFASASPTTDGKQLFVSFGSQGFYCYSFLGELKWKRDLGKVKTRNNFGEGASLTVADDHLIVVRDNEVRSAITVLDAGNGRTIWEKNREEPSCWSTPVVVNKDGRNQLITNGHQRVRSYELKTGKLFWECGGQVMNVTPCPIVDQNHVYCMSGYRGNVAMAIKLDSKGDVSNTDSVSWKLTDGTPYVPSPILYDGLLYFNKSNNNILTCVEANTGKIVYQRQRLPGIRNMYASPTGAGGKMFFVDRAGTTLVMASGREFRQLAVNQLDDKFDASPVLVGKEILLRGRKSLYCIAEMDSRNR